MGRLRFSANLGFLWADRPLADAIHAAKAAGFDAVECHWPYDEDLDAVKSALGDTGLPMLGLNTVRGNVPGGENGLSALPGRMHEARAAIDQAIDTALLLEAGNVHVMAGRVDGAAARKTFIENLEYACERAKNVEIDILIEPLNQYDAPGYFLSTTGQAETILKTIDTDNLKLMFDCYHVQLMEGDLTNRLKRLLPIIGHIQFASVPDRGPPEEGEVNYRYIFQFLSGIGYDKPLGAEYKPVGGIEQSLGWMRAIS